MNLSEIMEREGIYQIRRYLVGRFSVTLDDGHIGAGATVGEALDNAKKDGAACVKSVAYVTA